MSFKKRRRGLTRFKTGFGIQRSIADDFIDRWIDRSSYREESSCNKLGKRGEINSRLELMGFSLAIAECNLFSLSLFLSRAYVSKPNFIDAKSWPRNWFSRC